MLTACNVLFDWLSVHFPHEAGFNMGMFSALLVKFKPPRADVSPVRLGKFF